MGIDESGSLSGRKSRFRDGSSPSKKSQLKLASYPDVPTDRVAPSPDSPTAAGRRSDKVLLERLQDPKAQIAHQIACSLMRLHKLQLVSGRFDFVRDDHGQHWLVNASRLIVQVDRSKKEKEKDETEDAVKGLFKGLTEDMIFKGGQTNSHRYFSNL